MSISAVIVVSSDAVSEEGQGGEPEIGVSETEASNVEQEEQGGERRARKTDAGFFSHRHPGHRRPMRGEPGSRGKSGHGDAETG